MSEGKPADWKPTACILCENNCGIEVQLGGEDHRTLARIRGDKAHPESRGYLCQKATRLDYYQNGLDRLTTPLRRRPDGSFQSIDWETAIREVAEKLGAVRDQHGGDKIFYYGGGGQGNHLPGAYAGATLSALGVTYRSNALAQEKTGEFWVTSKMLGAGARGDYDHCEVAVFLGKNPWQSHGVSRARVALREIARDPQRSMIVIDPRTSETAELADYHLQLRPGTDAWLLSAMIAILLEEQRVPHDWIEAHVDGFEEVEQLFGDLPIADYCERCGVEEEFVRSAARRLAEAESASFYEDLGVQMNRHSTLSSYLNRLLWILTGNVGKRGGMNITTVLQPLRMLLPNRAKRSPVADAKIITGLVPCNVIADEILTDHPNRYRAMIVESANPAHSLADSQRMREALAALNCLVVVDVAMTETARLADYVLPVPTQYEKWEASFFTFEFPHNCFQLRRPLFEPPPDLLTEPEIHARLVEALGAMPDCVPELAAAANQNRLVFARAFAAAMEQTPELRYLAPVVLYRTLGPTLEQEGRDGAASASVLWAAAHNCLRFFPDSIERAEFGNGPLAAEKLFDAILEQPSGVVFSVDDYKETWKRVRTAGGRVQAALPELFEELQGLRTEQPPSPTSDYPLVLSAGERRSFTANTIYRDPDWRTRDVDGALRLHPTDAEALGLADGSPARLTTRRGSTTVEVEISERMQPGHISLPNGLGVDNLLPDGSLGRRGVAPNELTASNDRDWLAGTPWHKNIPARLEVVSGE